MTPVSFAPVTPAVRSDSHADSAKSGDSDDFAALLGRTAGQQSDDNRSNTPVKRETSGVSKHSKRSARAAASQKQDSDASQTKAADASPSEAHRAVHARPETGDDPAAKSESAPASSAAAAVSVAPVAARLTLPASAVATGSEQIAVSSAEVADAVSRAIARGAADVTVDARGEKRIVDAAVDHRADAGALKALARDAKVSAGDVPLEHVERAPSQAALPAETMGAVAPSPSRPTAVQAMAKSPSWLAAAAALRDALQKSGTPSQSSQSTAHSAQVSTTASVNDASNQAHVGATVLTLPNLASSRSGRNAPNPAESVHTAPGLAEAAAVTLAATIGDARQQSAGSHADLGNGSSMGYKAPLKQPSVAPVFSMPAAFARTLETGAAMATPALPPSFASSDLSSVGTQIVKGLQLQVTAGGGDMRLTLTPEHLGTVSIEVRVEHDRVKATLMADTPAVRQWIATHQDDLRQSLTAAGLTLDDLVVKEDGRQSQQEAQDDRPATPQKRRSSRPDSEQLFEVVV
jgi:flagellar hook-length control protein FliK